MTQASVALSRFRITIDSPPILRRAFLVLSLLGCTFACEERFTGIEPQAGGGSSTGGSNAGMGGTTGGSSATGGTGGTADGGSADGGTPGGGTEAGGTEAGGTTSGGTSAGSGAEGGEGGEPGEVEPPIPTDGLLLWLRADRGVTQADGLVSKWEDGSSAGNDAVQTADNAQPSFLADAFGGQPALSFDEGRFLRLPAGFSDFSLGLSVFVLGSFHGTPACSGVFHLGNGPEVNDIEVGQLNAKVLYEVADQYPVSDLFAFETPGLISVVHRPTTTVDMRWNQDLGLTPSVMLPAAVTRTDNVVGKSLYENCGPMNGHLAEFILYKRAVSDEELVVIEGYLQQRYDCCD